MSNQPNIIYHSVEPEANRSSYTQFNTIDFVLNTDRNLIANSVRIEGKLNVLHDGTTRARYSDRIHLNKRIGIHALIESARTQVGGNIIENIKTDYPRFVHMMQSATMSQDDYYAGSQLCELKYPTTDASIIATTGKATKTSNAQVFEDIDFSFKPMICLNRMSNDLQMSRVGNEIRLSFNLNRMENFLQGIGQVAGTTYTINDLRLTFRTKPPASVPQVQMNSVVDIKMVLQSANANLSTRVPAVCNAVSISFLKQTKENQLHSDNHALEKPPRLDEVQFLFNDATNQLVQYQQTDFGEYMDGYLSSLKSQGVHNASANLVRANSVFGIGLDFNGEVDLSNQKISVQLKSSVSNTNQYVMFMYFHSLISL
jgi:hypothetical protein